MGAVSRSDGSALRAGSDATKPRPHEQIRDYLLRSTPSPEPWRVDIETLRKHTRERVLSVRGNLTPVACVEEVDAGGVRGRLYRPTGAEGDVLVWAHGGGWMHGDLDCCEGVARALAVRADCAVLAVDYRLAPEHPFPAGLDDVWTATEWARSEFARLAVGGDSSGGNLAAAVALKASGLGLALVAQLLVYPVLDSTEDTGYKQMFEQRYRSFAGENGYGAAAAERLKYIWQTYVPDPELRVSPLASPLHASTFRGVAPAIVISAEHDFLRGEGEEYGKRLSGERVPVEAHTYAGQIHGFFEMLGVLDDARHAVGVAGDALRRAFVQHRQRFQGGRR